MHSLGEAWEGRGGMVVMLEGKLPRCHPRKDVVWGSTAGIVIHTLFRNLCQKNYVFHDFSAV